MADTIVIMAGGTGGHIFPGLAVAKSLEAKGYEIHWLGAYGLETTLVPNAGIPLHSVPIKGLRGNGVFGWIKLPFQLTRAVWNAMRFLQKVKPKCVVGFGGYAAAPGGIAAKLLGIPVIIHEQNAVAGMVNKLLSKFSTKTLSGFPVALPDVEVVGNPVRKELLEIKPYQERYAARGNAPLRLLIVGGSQGAKRLNEIVFEAIGSIDRPVEIYHQVGKNWIEHYAELKESAGLDDLYRPVAFIDDMKSAYEWADLVICRAGALTVAEVLAVNVASFFVPFPYAVDDHQTENCRGAFEAGAAFLVQERDLTSADLADTINQFTRETAVEMAEKSESLAKKEATNTIVTIIQKVIK